MSSSTYFSKTTNTTTSSTTENDEAIAQALARSEQERADANLARQLEARQQQQQQNVVHHDNNNNNTAGTAAAASSTSSSAAHHNPPTGRNADCPGRHGLRVFQVLGTQQIGSVECNLCHKRLRNNERAFGCVICNYDLCENCYANNSGTGQRTPPPPAAAAATAATAPPQPFFPPPQQQQQQNRGPVIIPDHHMCIVPCVIGDTGQTHCVEMMIDTGAQTSVMSLSLARTLKLENRIDRSQQGIAAGVGHARILGKLRNVIVELGHVEFPMDFIVLDVAHDQQLLLLGLDLMRKYKCIVDLERSVIVFGGTGGVEVHMLPPDEQQQRMAALRNQCPLM